MAIQRKGKIYIRGNKKPHSILRCVLISLQYGSNVIGGMRSSSGVEVTQRVNKKEGLSQ